MRTVVRDNNVEKTAVVSTSANVNLTLNVKPNSHPSLHANSHANLSANSNAKKEQPDVLDYHDYRKFLQDKIECVLAHFPKLSQRGIALKAGFKSPHLLGMILNGHRKLSEENLVSLAVPLKLTLRELDYLKLIVQIENAKSDSVRQKLFGQLRTQFFSGNFTQIQSHGNRLLRTWALLAIRELVTLKNFKPCPKWISQKMGFSVEHAQWIMDELIEIGMLTAENGLLAKADPSIHNFGKMAPALLANYNQQVLEQAARALSRGRDKKYNETLNMAIPSRLLPILKEQIKRFVRELDVLVESHTDRDEVWILSVQMFSVTDIGENSL